MAARDEYPVFDGPSLSAALVSIRQDRGWNQQELADWAGLNRTYVSMLESRQLSQQVERLFDLVAMLGYQFRLVPVITTRPADP